MKRNTRLALAVLAAVLLFPAVWFLAAGPGLRIRTEYVPGSAADPLPVVEVEDPETVRVENVAVSGGRVEYDVLPLRRGSSMVYLKNAEGEILDTALLTVGALHILFDEETGSFTCGIPVMLSVTALLLTAGAAALGGFRRSKGPAFYSYTTVFRMGLFIFMLLTGANMLNVTLHHLMMPEEYTMRGVYYSLSTAPVGFLNLTLPLLLLFSLALAVSNLALMRKDRPGVRNALGLLLAFLLTAGGLLGLWLTMRDFSGSVDEYRRTVTAENIYCTVYAYCVCMLAGAAVCGIRAARNDPPADRDVIIILGCWFRKDGTLPPLLRGRADRAAEYWKKHLEQTGREAWLIPSGGQGRDEPMPEASAIRNYLAETGIPERLILPETRSANTFQNFAFSRRIMEERELPGEAVFATSDYHAFRSGVWAARAGVRAESVCSRTRWWFWPNAFVRELAGLLASRWKEELVLLLGIVAFFSLLSMTLVG